jgi:hypothetical protein
MIIRIHFEKSVKEVLIKGENLKTINDVENKGNEYFTFSRCTPNIIKECSIKPCRVNFKIVTLYELVTETYRIMNGLQYYQYNLLK